MSDEIAVAAEGDVKAAALNAYNAVVEHAELLDIRLTDLKFSVKPKFYPLMEAERSGEVSLQRSFDVDVSDSGYDPEIGSLGGVFTWRLKVSQSRTKLLTVDASFFVVYRNVPEVERQHADAYLQRVGRFATYPYFRSLVAQMSWESASELPIMPVLK
ncbi:hypothetical protein SAMN05892877_12170 [Rhizobium subbaraonis]|uniref:Uncharacterized protein n=1 Tax=Rhizobium subbaraonis TaxID=908946 RepID=A0A285UWH8_9HYPH|nr:hypothetical protein [Rhizobium subbaraonis]SOC46244.1 hypothetical protein SAMN05892877_12170 [Rhizobium subbaraonis]